MSALFAKPQTPTVTAPPPMPDNSSPAVLEAQATAAAAAAARAGRLSTILTGQTSSTPAANRGNSDTYAAKTLGGGS